MVSITELARAEKEAAQAEGKVKAELDAATWRLNLGLAAVPQERVSQAYDEACAVLGLTRQYIAKRRSVTLRVAPEVIESGAIFKLPPRKAMAWATAKPGEKIDNAAVETLMRFEEEGVSLRAMAAELGASVPSWQSAGQRQAELDAALGGKPTAAQVREAIRSDPGFAREIVKDRKTADVIETARQSVRDERLAASGITPPRRDPELDAPIEVLRVVGQLESARASVVGAARGLADVPMTDQYKAFVLDALAKVEVAVQEMRHVVDGDAALDAALAAMMGS